MNLVSFMSFLSFVNFLSHVSLPPGLRRSCFNSEGIAIRQILLILFCETGPHVAQTGLV